MDVDTHERIPMKYFMFATLLLTLPACSGTTTSPSLVSADAGRGDAQQDTVVETVLQTNPWPFYSGDNGGNLVAPNWRDPEQFGCERSVRATIVTRANLMPGDAREVVTYGEVLGVTCRPPNTQVRVIDSSDQALLMGDCNKGFSMGHSGTPPATIRFGTPEQCAKFEKMRTLPDTFETTLTLISLTPTPEFLFVSSTIENQKSLGVNDGSKP
jgi:hypothetical protein